MRVAYQQRGRIWLYRGDLPKALADFSQASALKPNDGYAAIWLDIAAQRNGLASSLAQAAAQIDMTKGGGGQTSASLRNCARIPPCALGSPRARVDQAAISPSGRRRSTASPAALRAVRIA